MQTFILSAVAIVIFQCLLFIVALLRKNNGIADIGWGIGFIVIAALASRDYFFRWLFENIFRQQSDPDFAFVFIVVLVVVWALRLSIYLFIRNWSKPEDWRYANWREEWGKNFVLRSLLQVFLLQGVFMLVIGSPIIFSALQSKVDDLPYALWQLILIVIGIATWGMGFFFQAVGDTQLYRFKKNPANKGRIMRYGVWQYTRHPNYFGEAAMWWGIFLLSSVSVNGILGVLLRVIGPATITFMLLRVSGVTMLEGKYKGNIEYEEYQAGTSAFVPLLPKKKR